MSFQGSGKWLRRVLIGYVVAIIWLLAGGCLFCQVADASQTLPQMYHSRWTIRDGAPSGIETIAQTLDGYIWLGTDNGLVRFDGRSFERYHPSSGEDLHPGTIVALLATPDGGLWIGYAMPGASFLKAGHNVNFGAREGLTHGSINEFARDQSGTIWASSYAALWRLERSRWEKVDTDWGFPADQALGVFIDSRDTVWVGSGRQVFFLRRGSKHFELAFTQQDSSYHFAEASDGSVWVALQDSAQIRKIAGPDGKLIQRTDSYHYSWPDILFDSDGSLWIATDTQGIFRVPTPPDVDAAALTAPSTIQHFSTSDGLTGDNTYKLLRDREGGIWSFSNKGLDHFRPTALTVVDLPPDWFDLYRIAIVPSGPHSVLAVDKSIVEIDGSGAIHHKAAVKQVTCAYRDPQGTIWIGGWDGLWRYTSKGLVAVRLPDGLDPGLHLVQTMTMDQHGGLWVSFLHTGFMYFADDHWTKPAFPSAAVHDPGLFAYTDSKGAVWFGLDHNRVDVLSGSEQIRYGPETGVDVDDVTAIYEAGGRVWLGGKTGVDFQEHGRFRPLRLAGDSAIEAVSGIVQTTSGDLWINQATGVLRIAAAEIDKAIRDPRYGAQYLLYNYLDGLTDAASQIRPNPTLIQTENGRLYVATRSGLAWIDPDSKKTPAAPPEVFVTSISVDGKQTRDPQNLRLPVHANTIQLDYTATSLLIPERVRFQYKLEGFDKTWQQAGTRRQAFYSALPPGQYRFRVTACNSEGIWNLQGADLTLEIPPSFLQSLTFKVLCAVAAVAVLALLYQIRLRWVLHQVRTRLYERLAERERIARDLHDTFFQAIQGLLLRFNTGTALLRSDEPARAILDDALRQSDQVMMEGRELVLDLRTGSAEGRTLSTAFSDLDAELRKIHAAEYKVIVHGQVRDLHPVVLEECCRLGKEALNNAFRHSHASRIEAELIYEPTGLRLRFRDNGIGIDPKILSEGRRIDHWGLPGMRERARKIGAHIDIWSRKGAGTEIELRIPASVAYAARGTSLSSRLTLKRFRTEQHIYE